MASMPRPPAKAITPYRPSSVMPSTVGPLTRSRASSKTSMKTAGTTSRAHRERMSQPAANPSIRAATKVKTASTVVTGPRGTCQPASTAIDAVNPAAPTTCPGSRAIRRRRRERSNRTRISPPGVSREPAATHILDVPQRPPQRRKAHNPSAVVRRVTDSSLLPPVIAVIR